MWSYVRDGAIVCPLLKIQVGENDIVMFDLDVVGQDVSVAHFELGGGGGGGGSGSSGVVGREASDVSFGSNSTS